MRLSEEPLDLMVEFSSGEIAGGDQVDLALFVHVHDLLQFRCRDVVSADGPLPAVARLGEAAHWGRVHVALKKDRS